MQGYKVTELNRFVDRYGAYLSHMNQHTEDSAVKSVDNKS